MLVILPFGLVLLLALGNAITLVALAVAAMWAVFKLAGKRQEQRLDDRFDALDKALGRIAEGQNRNAAEMARLERDFLQMKAELPLNYVRREDYVQAVATIMAKLDGISLRFENILLRGVKHHE